MARETADHELGSRIREWSVRTVLTGTGDVGILAGVCEQLNAAGVSIARAAIGADLLDPTYDGVGAFWHRGRGVTQEEKPACACALDAAVDQRRRIAALNERRIASELPVTGTHIARHVGEVLYGNVGSRRRLDFTVLGPAVNETARIEALCGSLDQPVIVSFAFAEAAGDARAS